MWCARNTKSFKTISPPLLTELVEKNYPWNKKWKVRSKQGWGENYNVEQLSLPCLWIQHSCAQQWAEDSVDFQLHSPSEDRIITVSLSQGPCCVGLAKSQLRIKWPPTTHSRLPATPELSMIGHCRRVVYFMFAKENIEISCKVGKIKTHLSNFLQLLQGFPQVTDGITFLSPPVRQSCTCTIQLEPHNHTESSVNYWT